jgi:hypothetical protein
MKPFAWIALTVACVTLCRAQEIIPTDGVSPIRILKPANGSQVPRRPVIEGLIVDSTAKVFVIIHPADDASYSVQPEVIVNPMDGSWKVRVYVGRVDDDYGKPFQIMAVANPKERLKQGDTLSSWPESEWKSEMIEIIRSPTDLEP